MASSAKERRSPHAWYAIPFGSQMEHVNVDFNAASPHSVTAVLCACLRDDNHQAPSSEQVWRWPVTARMQGLLTVVRNTQSRPLQASAQCPHCTETLSFDLPLERFVMAAGEPVLNVALADGDQVQLRLPTGLDQRLWLQRGETDAHAMAQDLLLDGAPQPSDTRWLALVQAALEAADPLTSLELEAECPDCATSIRQVFNLEQSLLQRLRGKLADMLRDVHRLARRYHWSEMDILRLPAQRRAFYLACLARED